MKIIAGNWKMNGDAAALDALLTEMQNIKTDNKIILCLPATLISQATGQAGRIAIGGQDCSAHSAGAFTGEISAAQLADAGAKYVIVGHSERRSAHGETNEIVREKAQRAIESGLTPIICVSDMAQVDGSIPDTGDIIIAFEPVSAIGTGCVPAADDIAKMHRVIAQRTGGRCPILYGGSVKGANVCEIIGIDKVDGVLVGGASLTSDDFIPISICKVNQ